MRTGRRHKTTPRVRNGRVQTKHRTVLSEFPELTDDREFSVRRFKLEPGFIHLPTARQVHAFVELIGDWSSRSKGLSALILDGEGCRSQLSMNYIPQCYHSIWLSAFPRDMTLEWSESQAEGHRDFLQMLGVQPRVGADGTVRTEWTREQAVGWQLLHLFLYDLYCHGECMRHDGIVDYQHDHDAAQAYANTTAREILPAYERTIGRF